MEPWKSKERKFQKGGMADLGKELLYAQQFPFPTGQTATVHFPACPSGWVWPLQ